MRGREDYSRMRERRKKKNKQVCSVLPSQIMQFKKKNRAANTDIPQINIGIITLWAVTAAFCLS